MSDDRVWVYEPEEQNMLANIGEYSDGRMIRFVCEFLDAPSREDAELMVAGKNETATLRQQLADLAAQLAAAQSRPAEIDAQEPVAWSIRDKRRRFVTECAKRAAEYESLGQTIAPLYGRATAAECDCPAEKMPFGRCCKASPVPPAAQTVASPQPAAQSDDNLCPHCSDMHDVLTPCAAQKEPRHD